MQEKFIYDPIKYGTHKPTLDINNLFFAQPRTKDQKLRVVYDFETTGFKDRENKVYLWSMYWKDRDPINHNTFPIKKIKEKYQDQIEYRIDKNGGSSLTGIDIASFADIIQMKTTRRIVLYAHNGAKFDGTYLFRHLTQNYQFHQDLRVVQEKNPELYEDIKELIFIRLKNNPLFKGFDKLLIKLQRNPQDEAKMLNEYWTSPASLRDGEFSITLKKGSYYQFQFANFKIWDSVKMFAMSVKQMGKSLNKQYQTKEYSKMELLDNEGKAYKKLSFYSNIQEALSDGNEVDYNIKDCFIVWKFLEEQAKVIPEHLWKMTAGSTAFNTFKAIFAEVILNKYPDRFLAKQVKQGKKIVDVYYDLQVEGKPLKIGGKDKLKKYIFELYFPIKWLLEHDHQVRKYYRGGLVVVEPSKQGLLRMLVGGIDYNSHYSGVMNKHLNLMPYLEPVKYDPHSKTQFHLITLTITKDMINKKGLPFITNSPSMKSAEYNKTLKAGEVFYITSVEFERFKKYYQGGSYTTFYEFSFETKPADFFFGEYIALFYGMKAKAKFNKDEPLKQAAKLFLNAIYGKFASKMLLELVYFNEKESTKVSSMEVLSDTIYYLPMGLAITAYARMGLVDTVKENVRYITGGDTDSLYFEYPKEINSLDKVKNWLEKTFEVEVDEYKLGAIDIEKWDYFGIFKGPKNYVLQSYQDGHSVWTVAGYQLEDDEGNLIKKTNGEDLVMEDTLLGFQVKQLRPSQTLKKEFFGVLTLEEYDKDQDAIWDMKKRKEQQNWLFKDETLLEKTIREINECRKKIRYE